MKERLWRFINGFGSFESSNAHKIKSLYFPLANEVIMSSVSCDLHGDIKISQDSFLLQPVSRIDLINLRSSRNFWVYIDKDNIWSATGVSKDLERVRQDRFKLKAGLLWHKIERENKKIGLKSEILSFVPVKEPVEVMQIRITNTASKKIKFFPCAAIPIYARSADNIRDHRQVTSLLQRISLHKFGVVVRPTLVFNESGHKPNKTIYFILGWDQNFNPPQYLYPTQEMFCADAGDLEAPGAILNNLTPQKDMQIQGKDAIGALRFYNVTLEPAQSKSYIILLGIVEDIFEVKNIIKKFNALNKVNNSFTQTKKFWISLSNSIVLATGNPDFDNWFRWVSIQPVLRRMLGCSFLPDFDYGKGGGGWRDLWQDCLGLILNNPKQAPGILLNNFRGIRIDGSNATIIGKNTAEFLSDRNNISRVWMDHGIWPLLTLDLYINETGQLDILFERLPYFRNHEICRTRAIDYNWSPDYGQKLKTSEGKVYYGTVLEHLLVENLVQFFNVGRHNNVRLEGADWNDGLDMAAKSGESIAFSSMYAQNLKILSDLLLKINKTEIKIARELKILLDKISYNNVKEKTKALDNYFNKTKFFIQGDKVKVDKNLLAHDLKEKSEWMANHIRKNEWLKEGFFNGYYDNKCKRTEGRKNNTIRMMLGSQVFPIMSEVAYDWQVEEILKSVKKYLFDKRLKGYHLNTDFIDQQPDLGRAFSFVYGEKENGAFFNHMIVMFAYALYKRGFVKDGFSILNSIYNMAVDTKKSKIYPGIPEYFNLEGQGMYAYLTGSASWFVLTVLTQVFGVRGKEGNLLIEPKLVAEQFKDSSNLGIVRTFAGKTLRINFSNPKKLDYGKYRIVKATLNSHILSANDPQAILIERKTISQVQGQAFITLYLDTQ
jgi:cellobiose phosphorylase